MRGRLPDETVSTAPARPAAPAGTGACLFVVARGDEPLAAPARVRLRGVDEVRIGRGEGLDARRRGDACELTLPDREVSGRHARVTRVGAGWGIEDRGSKNGTIVNGARVTGTALADGDVIEIGRALLRFRHDVVDGDVGFAQPAARRGLASVLPAVQAALDALAEMAAADVPILVEGETGTGKEVAARNVHALSGRTGDFVAVNCGALARERVEAELFGWKRGAFTGAVEHLGLVRAADGGTLFLDEIGDLPLRDQATLLRVLQEREVLPIGATRPVPVALRVIAATNRPLDAMVRDGGFREDLLARLDGFRFAPVPLRARREDLGLLIGDLLRARPDGGAGVTFTTAALRALVRHGWPGNVRALVHALAGALVQRRDGEAIDVVHLPRAIRDDGGGVTMAAPEDDDALRLRLEGLLSEHGGNTAAVARAMGKAPMQIWRWCKRLGIEPRKARG